VDIRLHGRAGAQVVPGMQDVASADHLGAGRLEDRDAPDHQALEDEDSEMPGRVGEARLGLPLPRIDGLQRRDEPGSRGLAPPGIEVLSQVRVRVE
jgi:hypothetical protein